MVGRVAAGRVAAVGRVAVGRVAAVASGGGGEWDGGPFGYTWANWKELVDTQQDRSFGGSSASSGPDQDPEELPPEERQRELEFRVNGPANMRNPTPQEWNYLFRLVYERLAQGVTILKEAWIKSFYEIQELKAAGELIPEDD